MRRALIIFPILLLTTLSCTKDKKSCWGCVVLYSDGYVTSYGDSMICDKTGSEINDIKGTTYDGSAQGYVSFQINQCSRQR